jgi:hypothetical protein
MPLPPAAARRHVHTRKVRCEGFLREDGLWEVEATLIDLKPFAHDDFERGRRQPTDPVHHMSIRLTVDRDLVVVDAQASMEDVPYLSCNDVPPRVSALVGIRLGSGWREAMRARIPRLQACTHLLELIGPAITTLYQSMSYREPPDRDAAQAARQHPEKPFFLDGCYSWRADGPNVAKFFPQFAKAKT